MDIEDVWRHIDVERRSLEDTLATLADASWETGSLCPGWRVRDVAAHVIASPQYRWRDFVPMMIRARLDVNRAILEDGQRRGRASTADILEQFDRFRGARTVPPTTTPYEPLVDILVHTQDMYRPLGIEHAMPVTAATVALDRVLGKHDKLFAAHGLDEVRVVATDVDWSRGQGPEVRAPVQEILMLATGRVADASLVEGEGAGLVRCA